MGKVSNVTLNLGVLQSHEVEVADILLSLYMVWRKELKPV